MASVDDVREDAAGAQGGHLRAEDVVRDMTSAIDRFVATSKANVHQYRKKDRELTVEQDKKLQLMKQSKKRLKEVQERQEREQEKESRQLSQLQTELTALQHVEEKLPKDLENYKRELKTQERALARLQALVSTKKTMAEIRTTELSKAVSYYAQFLGLTLEALPEESAVRFVFTQIDPAQASREYYFVLANTPSEEEDPKVSAAGTQTFLVSECEPKVNYKSALAALNASQNLTGFFIAMRKLFVASARTKPTDLVRH